MKTYFLFVFLLSFPQYSLADVPEAQKHEVAYLLDLVKASSCEIERNGTRHSGQAAYDHIKKKYNHFRKKITSTEDFIAYAATKSTMSGKEYMTVCGDNEPVPTGAWLLSELQFYREREGK